MKQQTVNEFKDGLNLDLHPLVTPKTVLTDNINGTFITYNGNEFCLQNDRGNKKVAELTPGYTPIGVKEHNGILYIISVKNNSDDPEHPSWVTEIGTFPSLEETVTLNDEDFYEIELGFDKEDAYIEQTDSWIRAYKSLKIGENHSNFTNVDLGYDIEHPVTIEIQDSYDGSVNLILVADGKPTKIINSGFSKMSDDVGKWIKRSQTVDTNVYHLTDENQLNQEINLIRTSTEISNVDLLGVQAGGQFKGGNYTFYIKFGDADYNQTDVVAESGIVSIFNGNDGVPSTISGTLLDERTDKMINLRILGLNPVYSKIYIYYSREYSDTQGYRMTEYGMFSEPIDMDYDENRTDLTWDNATYQDVWLTGFEQTVPIDSEILNIDYHTIDWARAETQHSNMLFLGNVGQKQTYQLYDRLKNKSLQVKATYNLDSITPVKVDYSGGKEYYSVKNVYSKVGYYPGEIYRFGIVYILNDGSKTPVFNIPGWNFQEFQIGENDEVIYTEIGDGVCLMPKEDVITPDLIKPIYLTFTIPTIDEPNVIGWFIVRQKRIPNIICEGLSIAVDEMSNTPVVFNGESWVSQSFLAADRIDNFWAVSNAQLEYNNSSFVSAAYTDAEFEEWRQQNNKTFTSFLIDLNDVSDGYTLDSSTVDLGEGGIESKIETGINLIIQQYFTAYPEKAIEYSDYHIYTYIKDDDTVNVDDEDYVKEQQLWALQHDGVVQLHWYRLYNEEDEPTTTVFVGLVGNLVSVKQTPSSDPIHVVNITKYNNYLLSLWKTQYLNTLSSRTLTKKFMKEQLDEEYWKEANALLSLDPCVNNSIGSMLDGSNFNITLERPIEMSSDNIMFTAIDVEKDPSFEQTSIVTRAVFVDSNTAVKVIDTFEYSTIAGNANDVASFKYFSTPTDGNDATAEVIRLSTDIIQERLEIINSSTATEEEKRRAQEEINLAQQILDEVKEKFQRNDETFKTNRNINLIRGLFCPFVGLTHKDSFDLGIYSIKHKDSFDVNDFLVRRQNNSEYYCVSNYNPIEKTNADVFRGDCFTNTVSIRIIRNFIDPVAPVNDTILDKDSWEKYVYHRDKDETAEDKRVRYDLVNLSDVNTVDLGYWVTFKCMSSYNLGLRSKDAFHVDEMSLLGSPRSFYPLNGASTATGNKMEESFLLNDGLSATVGRKRYNLMPDVPYSKSEFSNRIMFSNINITDSFTNGYRTFQGLSYKDYDKQYGPITKLISLGQNIFVVMEHGLGLVPVNPKALMQTTTGETIHIYGYGVLPDEMTIISQDYGSKYEHSVIRTPIGIYGIDVDAKKIWRFSDKQGFETISDMKIETYLKDFLSSRQIEMGTSDIRTHYNGKKGDLMFAWYPKVNENPAYMICYNERQNIWTTKYDWYPIVSENINDEFYSLNNEAIWDHAEDVGYNNTHVSSWYDNNHKFEFEFVVSDPIGVNKVFDNLQIISNNVQPDEMEITVIGDDYVFKRTPVDLTSGHKERREYEDIFKIHTTSDIHGDLESTQTETEHSPKGHYHFDKRLNQSVLTKWQPFKDIYKFGRRVGNIQYKDGSWFAQIEPILVTDERLVAKEARIRDKWAKIRIRYSGKDLAIITAIKTLINI